MESPKIVGRDRLERVRTGIEAIRRTYHIAEPPPKAFIEAIEIYDRGHRDSCIYKGFKLVWLLELLGDIRGFVGVWGTLLYRWGC